MITGTFLGFPLGVATANYAVTFSALGFVSGTIFSAILSAAEARRTFGRLSLPRFVAWGAIGGLVLGGLAVGAGLFGAGLTILGAAITGVSTLLGAGSAAGTLAVARVAHRQVLSNGEAVPEPALAGETARQR